MPDPSVVKMPDNQAPVDPTPAAKYKPLTIQVPHDVDTSGIVGFAFWRRWLATASE